MKRPKPLEVSRDEIKALRDRAKAGELRDEDAKLVEALAETVVVLSEAVEKKGTSIRRLLRMLFGAKTESKRRLLGNRNDNDPPSGGKGSGPGAPAESEPKPKPKGHGRNGAAAYTGAERVSVKHSDLKPGIPCPACERGTLYSQPFSPVVHLHAQLPVNATVYECERLRCGGCGKVFTAPAPAGAVAHKYHRNVGILIALLKYGAGMPFARLENLQKMAGIPLPASVQWERVAETAEPLWGLFDTLWEEAAQGEILHNDDTGMKVLELIKENNQGELGEQSPRADPSGVDPQRTGIFTSGIVSVNGQRRIALFRTGRQHAGENLAELLGQRIPDASAPIQMCDALSRNLPAQFKVLLANCLAHARRYFVNVVEAFPEPCEYVIELLAEIYKHDAHAREQKMDARTRLIYHQEHSGPLMDNLHQWCEDQLDERLVEPNSGLGEAIGYMLRHWEPLSLFLREPGTPLDNNICERALKKAILHRKNSMFYKTQRGARVGDLFMSLIHTCGLNGVNALHYLQALSEHARHLAEAPEHWLPWNYNDTIAALPSS